MDYRPRVSDAELKSRLARAGAVLIEGPKACGKTESARQLSASELRVDTDPAVGPTMEVDPGRLLGGATPRLLDEWQAEPALWNYVRRAVDDRRNKGQFILTGSTNPVEDVAQHSGAGRISRMRMRPMSLWESGHSTGEVSLGSLLAGAAPSSGMVDATIEEIATRITVGGWPALQDDEVSDAAAAVGDYVDLIADVDLSRVSGTRRDPARIRLLLQSLARNVATEAPVATLASDVGGASGPLARDTVMEYLHALDRLMVIEDQPAWSTHLRSSATLRKSPKRHFVDPSIAVATLGADVPGLVRDLRYLGFLFESLAVRDLRIYAQAQGAAVSHYRDSTGREGDAIVHKPDGTWAAFEVKLGQGGIAAGAHSLLRLADAVDLDKAGAPAALTVITGAGFAHRRPDGVNVVPIATLRD